VLADFRVWLEQAAAAPAPPPPADEPVEPPDLHALLGQMIALRHEVNLQTKAVRAQQEQNAATLDELSRAIELASEAMPRAETSSAGTEDSVRPILKVLVDVADALTLARREFERGRRSLGSTLDELAAAPASTSWLARLFGPTPALSTAPEKFNAMLESLVTGYAMSLQRVERALEQLGLERMQCAGRPFDPERMEVVEVVSEGVEPAGQVVAEIRPGYLWQGRVFRFAQVSVARPRG
jgi:molecular chaperone GrpE